MALSLFWQAILGLPIVSALLFCLAGGLIERLSPGEAGQPLAGRLFNMAYLLAGFAIGALLNPILAAMVTPVVNALGGGLIALPSEGWALAASALLYIVAVDFLEYAFHRAQHAWPFLWAMHSFHHSDPAVNVTTTTRHFWFEMVVKGLLLYPVLALLFRVSPTVLQIYAASTVLHYINHLNLRLGFGPFAWLVNSPRYHRLHHSTLARHSNKNFAAYFPLFDLLFGTFCAPEHGEFPRTGLPDGRAPNSLLRALIWPGRIRLFPAQRQETI